MHNTITWLRALPLSETASDLHKYPRDRQHLPNCTLLSKRLCYTDTGTHGTWRKYLSSSAPPFRGNGGVSCSRPHLQVGAAAGLGSATPPSCGLGNGFSSWASGLPTETVMKSTTRTFWHVTPRSLTLNFIYKRNIPEILLLCIESCEIVKSCRTRNISL
jgi:hypothetical protein